MPITTNVPSNNFFDLKRDVEDATKWVNGSEPFKNRVGLDIKPIQQIISEAENTFNEQFERFDSYRGFSEVGDFSTGFTITSRPQILLYNGEWYRWDGVLPKTVYPGDTPYSSGGVSAGAWQSVGDASLRSALAEDNSEIPIAGFKSRQLRLIESVKDLIPSPKVTMHVKGFYSSSNVGGGEFYYDPNLEQTKHNGGTVIALAALNSWDGTHANLSALLGWSGNGYGCFVRLNANSKIYTSWFGAVGDGISDDSLAIQSALNTQLKVICNAKSRFLLENPIYVENKNVDFDLNGSELIQKGDFKAIRVFINYTDVQAVSEIFSGSLNLTNGDAGGNTTTARLKVSNANAYKRGDFVKLISDDIIPATDPSDKERSGEFAKVAEIDLVNNYVYLYSLLRDTYTTNTRLIKMQSGYKVSIYNGKMNHDTSFNPTWNQSLINIVGAFEPFVSVQSDYCRAELVEFDSCLGPMTYNLSAKMQTTSFANFAYGYTIIEYSCEGGVHLQPKGYDARHVYTTGVRGTDPLSADVWRYGRTRDFKVIGGYGFNCQNSAFDTHPDSDGGEFINCTARQPYNGPLGTQRNYQLRGQNGKIVNCRSYGGVGYYVNGSFAHVDSARGNKIINCYHEYLPVEQASTRIAFTVQGQSGFPVLGTEIINPQTKQFNGSIPHFYAKDGNMRIVNPDCDAGQTATSTSSVFVSDENSAMYIEGGVIDYTKSTAGALRTCRLYADTSRVEMYGTRLIGGDTDWLVDMQAESGGVDRNATFIGKGIKVSRDFALDTDGDGGLGCTNIGLNAVCIINYEINGNASANPAAWTESYAAGGSKTINTYLRGADTLLVTLTTTFGNLNVNNIGKGQFVGQRMILSVSPSSVGSFTLINGGTNINIVSNQIIAIGKSFALIWTGSSWVSG